MAHCKKEEIEDLKDTLVKIEKLEGIKTKRFGVYYLKSKGFLHFHSKDGKRWADVRDGKAWGEEIIIPFNASPRLKNNFLKEVKLRYERTINKKN